MIGALQVNFLVRIVRMDLRKTRMMSVLMNTVRTMMSMFVFYVQLVGKK